MRGKSGCRSPILVTGIASHQVSVFSDGVALWRKARFRLSGPQLRPARSGERGTNRSYNRVGMIGGNSKCTSRRKYETPPSTNQHKSVCKSTVIAKAWHDNLSGIRAVNPIYAPY